MKTQKINSYIICRSFQLEKIDEAVISLRRQGATAWVESDARTGDHVLFTDFGRLAVALAGLGRMLKMSY